MAYVAISERLRDDVRNTIRFKQNAELNLLVKPTAQLLDPNDSRVVDKFWGEYAHLKAIVPREWCRTVDSVQLVTDYLQDPADPASLVTHSHATGFIGGYTVVPPNAETYYPKLRVPNDAPEVADHIRYAREQHVINTRWNKVREDVMTFLTNCKSLNEALKLWPDIRIYIPQHYIDKAEEKTVKAKAAESKAMEILKQIDTDHAISSAVMVRILEANKQQETQL
jgi:hypothetical protein